MEEKMATIPELKTLKRGDFIDTTIDSGSYQKVLGVNKKGLWLTRPFSLNRHVPLSGGRYIPKGKLFWRFPSKAASIASYYLDHLFIYRGNDPTAKSLRAFLKTATQS